MNPKKRSNAWGKDGHWMLIALLTNVAFSAALQMQMVSDTESADIICSALGTKRNGLFQKLTREGSSCCILISQFWEKYVQLYTYQDLDPCCQVVNPKVPKSVYIQHMSLWVYEFISKIESFAVLHKWIQCTSRSWLLWKRECGSDCTYNISLKAKRPLSVAPLRGVESLSNYVSLGTKRVCLGNWIELKVALALLVLPRWVIAIEFYPSVLQVAKSSNDR